MTGREGYVKTGGEATKSRQVTVNIIVAISAAIAWRLYIGQQTLDDAYITYRYARNLATGLGFVYNPGEYVLGTTTPLTAVLLALGYLLYPDIPAAALSLGIAADTGAMLLLFVLARQQSTSNLVAICTTILYGFSWFCVRITNGGMESALFTFWVLLAIWSACTRRYGLASVVAAIATLIRPEGILVALSCLTGELIDSRRIPWRSALVYGALMLPWLIFAVVYFGSPIPHSVQSKAATFAIPPLQAIKSLIGYLTEAIIPFMAGHSDALIRWMFAALLLVLFGSGAYSILKRQLKFAPFWLFPSLYLVLYGLANPPVWEWYVVPLYPFAAFAVIFGLDQFTHGIERRLPARVPVRLPVLSIMIALTVVSSLLTFNTDHLLGRENAYRALANDWAPSILPGQQVAAAEIGTLGFYLPHAAILDTQGLVSPVSIQHQRQLMANGSFINGSIPQSLIVQEHPGLIIAPEISMRYSLLQDDWFTTNYRQVDEYPSRIWGSNDILVYQHMDQTP